MMVKGALLGNNQLTGIESSPRTLAFNISSPIKLSRASVGLNVTSFQMGVKSNTDVTGIYTYRIPLEKVTVILGFQGTATNISEKNSRLKGGEVGDERFLSNSSGWGYNLGMGLYMFNDKSFFSLSAPAWNQLLVQTDGSLVTEINAGQMPIFLSAGYEGRLNKDWWLNPYILLRHYRDRPSQADLTLLISHKNKVWAGPYYKTNSHYGLMIGAELNPFLKLSYAGGISQQMRPGFSGATHEVSILFNVKNKVVKTFNSLRFF